MNTKTDTKNPAPDPQQPVQQGDTHQTEEHEPHIKHHHVAIEPPQTGVKHLDPGAIPFS